ATVVSRFLMPVSAACRLRSVVSRWFLAAATSVRKAFALPPFKTPNTTEMSNSDTEMARSGFEEFTGRIYVKNFLHKKRPNYQKAKAKFKEVSRHTISYRISAKLTAR